MRRLRFGLSTAMALMAMAGLAMGLGLRSSQLYERARFHRDRASHFRLLSIPNHCANLDLLKIVKGPDWFDEAAPASPIAALILEERARKRAERHQSYKALHAYHSGRASEFERAAWLPWVHVTSYPPPPEPE